MSGAWLDCCLTDLERSTFEEKGYLVIEDALPLDKVENLIAISDRIIGNADEFAGNVRVRSNFKVRMDILGEDDGFLELVDWYSTFPKIWGILGWNIHVYHSHVIYTPPVPLSDRLSKGRLNWHQDSGRVSLDIETVPLPRISVKIAYFLTDVSKNGSGNFSVVPGSHLKDDIEYPIDGISDPVDAEEVLVSAGSAVIFDRRVYHSGGWNFSDLTRKVVFLGYSPRWFQPRDEMTVSHCFDDSDLVRWQLLGGKNSNISLTSPSDEDVPLRGYLQKHLGDEFIKDRSNRIIT